MKWDMQLVPKFVIRGRVIAERLAVCVAIATSFLISGQMAYFSNHFKHANRLASYLSELTRLVA